MVNIKFEIDGLTEFNRTFIRTDAVFSNLLPVWGAVRDAFWVIEKAQFASEGRAGRYGKWKSLTKRYAAEKIKKYGAKPILERTGRLVKSMTGQTSDTVYEKNSTTMAVGTSLYYARYAHKTRPIIAFSGVQKTYLQKEIQKSLVKQLRRGGAYFE